MFLKLGSVWGNLQKAELLKGQFSWW